MRTAVLRATLVAYAALLIAPAATVLPGPTGLLLAGGLAVGIALGTALTGRVDAAAWLSTVPRGLAGLAPALLWLVPAAEVGSIVTPWVLGAAATVPWLLAVAAASHCRMQDRIEAARTRVSFEARQAPTQRRQRRIAATVVLAAGVVSGVAILALGGGLDDGSLLTWLPGSMFVFLLLLSEDDEREATVTDAGLVIRSHRYGWDTIAEYELTDEALVLSRTDWYRSEFSFDREDIEDVEAVAAVLEEYVPQA